MNRSHFWKVVIIIGIVLWSLYEMYPPTSQPLVEYFASRARNQDDALKGIVERAQAAEKERPGRSYLNLVEAIGTNNVTRYFPAFSAAALNDEQPTAYVLNRLQRDAAGKIKLGLDLQGGTSFVLEMNTNRLAFDATNDVDVAQATSAALSQAVEVLRRRVDKFGVAEPLILAEGNDRIRVQLPGLSEAVTKNARDTLQRAAFLEFRMVHPQSEALLREGSVPPLYEVMRIKERQRLNERPKPSQTMLVKKKAERGFTGAYIKAASVGRDNLGKPEIYFNLNGAGADLFSQITRENLQQRLAIVLDGQLYSAPVIQSEIHDRGSITGDFDEAEAQELANVLENPLKAPLRIVEERTVDPSLGKDSISSGITAAAIAGICTFLFMVVFYFGAGLVANLALVLNVLILMGFMCALGATLTMPGIAGIALTIGMAVDANVLIYERMREEIAAGKSIRGVISASYHKAFGTIFDSNLTTVIAGLILIYFGTGPVKGFGVTLTIGICVSVFTAFFVTRLIYDVLLAKGWLKNVRMLPLAKFRSLPFMKWGKLTCFVSAIMILAGLAYGIHRGKKVLGVDFAGGESMTLAFSQRVEEDQLRNALDQAKLNDAAPVYQKNLSTGMETLQLVVPFGQGSQALSALTTAFPQAGFEVKGLDTVGASVGVEIQRAAITATLLSLFAILLYVAFRYEFSFAVASVTALIHDVLITMSIYFLSGRQLTAPMIAAVLTIIGYSINDKIVIMDRIREDLKLGVRGTFPQLIDLALNQTLSRTIITGGAVILATLSLLIFGGGVINDFAFTFLVGILAGTYSSLFVASPIVMWWHKGERPKIGGTLPTAESAAPLPVRG